MKRVRYVGPIFDHCYDEQTEVLTERGWLKFEDAVETDRFATLSETHELEFSKASRFIKQPWEGEMLHFLAPREAVDLLVTPNHNMYVQTESARRKDKRSGWRLEPASEVFGKHRIYKKNADFYASRGPEHVNIVGRNLKTEHWLEFLGYYLAEGSATTTARKDYIIQIRQLGDALSDMATALSRVTTGKVNIRPDGRAIVNDKDLCLYLKRFGHCHEKYFEECLLLRNIHFEGSSLSLEQSEEILLLESTKQSYILFHFHFKVKHYHA